MGYRCLSKNFSKRNKKAGGCTKSTLPENRMVIPRDHKGLLACEPFNHGEQTIIIGVSSKERKEPFDKEGNE